MHKSSATAQYSGRGSEIRWREWSKEAFEEARRENKIILLDLTASWCHWCHVMDKRTYSEPEIATLVNDNFVPVRVDIDRRPDVSERYNRGGFPTTAFLSDRGESIWGTTYIPPEDMARIANAILKAKRSGEIDQALEKDRAPYLHFEPRTPRSGEGIDRRDIEDAFGDVLSAYDPQNGGFGTEPKFPHPDALDLMIYRHGVSGTAQLADAVDNTLISMAEGLYDKVEGGLFRYSVTRDWSVPHYEKMLETNAGFLRNLARARGIVDESWARELASGVAAYLLKNLRDEGSGGFFGSQDAQEKYYRLDAGERAGATPPSVDRTVYAGWNCEAAAALIEAGIGFDQQEWIDAGREALEHALAFLLDRKSGLMRHTIGQDLFLLEDQAALISALVRALEIRYEFRLAAIGQKVIEGVDLYFRADGGGYGDRVADEVDVGEVMVPRRSLITNSRYAHAIALFGGITGRHELIDRARGTLSSFTPKELEAYGMFASTFVLAWETLEPGLATVEVHTSGDKPWTDPLFRASKSPFDPGVVVKAVADGSGEGSGWAVVCTHEGCSERMHDPNGLTEALRRRRAGQF